MANNVGLEWKRQSWQLGLIGLLAGFLVLIVPLIHWQPVPLLLRDASWPQLSVGGGIAVLLVWTAGLLGLCCLRLTWHPRGQGQ